MPIVYRSEDQLAKDLGDHIKESLVAMWAAQESPSIPVSGLVFPKKRAKKGGKGDPVTRVSEQESKIIATEWLRCEDYPFSIETPTLKRFRFSVNESGAESDTPSGDKESEEDSANEESEGDTDDGDGQSARTDVTIYQHNGKNLFPLLNIELKALQPKWEAFRKDLEKLLRENVEGMWFHTLEVGQQRSWDSIGWKLWQAFEALEKDLRGFKAMMEDSSHSVRFRVVALNPPAESLDPPQEEEFKIRFAHWREDLEARFPREEVKPKAKKPKAKAKKRG